MSATPQSNKGLWWGAVAVLALIVIGVAFFGTRASQHQDVRSEAAGKVGGVAYSDTSGKDTPAAAQPGALNIPAARSNQGTAPSGGSASPR